MAAKIKPKRLFHLVQPTITKFSILETPQRNRPGILRKAKLCHDAIPERDIQLAKGMSADTARAFH